MAENSVMKKGRIANEAFANDAPKAKKPFVEPLLTKHETLIENTLVGAAGGPAGVVALS